MKIAFGTSLFLNLLFAFLFVFKSLMNDPELSNKPEWSALQAAHSEDGKSSYVILRRGQHEIVGLKTFNSTDRVWVLANSQFIPRLKIMPSNSKVRISKADFEAIKLSTKLNEETELFLLNSIDD